ncbi:MAG TPA: prefoldin subunit beta [Thermoprotei archaeon]|nr:MAG: prefoldin subunit beta [Thermoprotei archaeon]HDI75251.1 prefoldin subunit beta [Thermoprotei archaeon]
MSEGIPPGLQAQMARLQQLQEELQRVLLRKEQWRILILEIDRALKELEKVSEDTPVYKISGPLMIKWSKEEAVKELKERREDAELHVKTLDRQESLIRKQIEDLRKRISSQLTSLKQGSA